MKKIPLYFQALSFMIALSPGAYAEAPVIDESQNFSQFEDQQVVTHTNAEVDEQPLIKDNDADTTPSNVNWLNKVQGLQQDLQELRGQLEVQANTIKQLQEQQLRFYKDFDTRLNGKAVSTKNDDAADVATAINQANLQSASPSNPADEQLSYLAAYDLVKDKRFDEALASMQSFILRFPHGGYTANAHYWLGELYMVKKNYSQAITQFETVLRNFPSSSKSAACTLKIGYALASSGKDFEARKHLQQVLKNYPDTPTAQLAAAKLNSMTAT